MDSLDSSDLSSLKSILQLKKQFDAPTEASLPESYKSNSDVEKLYLWSAENFRRQIRQKYPHLQARFLTRRNECQVEKLIMTFVKPSVLPFSHLFDISRCAQFVSDFIAFQAQPRLSEVHHLNSPTLSLVTQVGNSLEMSHCLVSLLSGFGFRAFVVCGEVDLATANKDRSNEEFQPAFQAQEAGGIISDSDDDHYHVQEPPILESTYSKFIEGLSVALHCQQSSDGIKGQTGRNGSWSEPNSASEAQSHLHAWVYVDLETDGFFIEATTGEKRVLGDPRLQKIYSVWNGDNYWLHKGPNNDEARGRWTKKTTLNLHSNESWIKFVADIEPQNKGHADKRLLSTLTPWLSPLGIPQSAYELTYRLGQKMELYHGTRVEYFAPYLLKDGMVQRFHRFQPPTSQSEEIHGRIYEKFRHRVDKMESRETYLQTHQVVETFGLGRADHLKEHNFFKLSTDESSKHITNFYHASRSDNLDERVFKDLEVTERYSAHSDGLQSMQASFIMAEKKFGPADSNKSSKEIAKITEIYSIRSSVDGEGQEVTQVLQPSCNPGRVLDVSQIMERVFDVENERIQIKFQRVGGQIFSKSVEFLLPKSGDVEDLVAQDIKVYMVDPRDEEPCLKELKVIFAEEMKAQAQAKARVDGAEREMSALLETRMKELSSNDLDVWVFDVKRNAHVKRGRQQEERIAQLKEESVVDLELDFLAPFLERQQSEPLGKAQAIKIRDECLRNVKMGLEEKERELDGQMNQIKQDLEKMKDVLTPDEMNSKKFLLNVTSARLERQKRHTIELFAKAEKSVMSDQRILQCLA